MDKHNDDSEELDPRVQGELESLNQATDEINKYETEISIERSNFKTLLAEATLQLNEAGKKLGNSINRARPYYTALKEANQARTSLQRAAQNFQRANGVYRAAKETINLAERRLSEFSDCTVDAAWQEVLNLQTNRFMDAETDKMRSELLHQQATKRFEFYEKKCKKLKKKHKNSTGKTKAYFEMKETLERTLQEQQKKVSSIQVHIDAAKSKYKQSLSNLASISSEIHEKRQASSRMMELLNKSESEKESWEQDSRITSHEFDLTGPMSYDDIEDLEKDLNDFETTDSGSDADSSSDSDNEDTISSSTDNSDVVTYGKPNRRQSNNNNMEHNSNKLIKKRPQPLGKASDSSTAVNEVKIGNVRATNSTFSQDQRNATYNCLHGTNSTNQDDDYDIFDDLC